MLSFLSRSLKRQVLVMPGSTNRGDAEVAEVNAELGCLYWAGSGWRREVSIEGLDKTRWSRREGVAPLTYAPRFFLIGDA